MRDPERISPVVEAVVATHLRRWFATYYIKAEGEVDVAFVSGGRFYPIEVKWSRQIRPKSLKQIRKYPNGRIWARAHAAGVIGGVPVEPLPVALRGLPGSARS